MTHRVKEKSCHTHVSIKWVYGTEVAYRAEHFLKLVLSYLQRDVFIRNDYRQSFSHLLDPPPQPGRNAEDEEPGCNIWTGDRSSDCNLAQNTRRATLAAVYWYQEEALFVLQWKRTSVLQVPIPIWRSYWLFKWMAYWKENISDICN